MSRLQGKSLLVRVYCLAGDTEPQGSLAEAIVTAAHQNGLAGATLLTGIMGYGRRGVIYSDVLSEYEVDREPVVVELVDTAERVTAFLPALQAIVRDRRLITVEHAEVVAYTRRVSAGG